MARKEEAECRPNSLMVSKAGIIISGICWVITSILLNNLMKTLKMAIRLSNVWLLPKEKLIQILQNSARHIIVPGVMAGECVPMNFSYPLIMSQVAIVALKNLQRVNGFKSSHS